MISRMTHFNKLPSAEGFTFNLRPAKIDAWAYEACSRHFGDQKIKGVVETLHRSSISYTAMVDDLLGYQVKPSPRTELKSYHLAYASVRQDLNIDTPLIPLTMGAVPQREDFPGNKSPGLPYKQQGFKTKREVIDAGKLHEINRDWQRIGFRKGKVELPDVCLFARAQIARKGKEKIRATWGYPLHVYLEEGRFFYPIMDWIKSREHDFPIAYGFETANGGMSVISEMLARNPLCKYICTDWKTFDKSIPPWLIRDAFAILAECIDWSHVKDVEGKIWSVRPGPSKIRWKRMIDYFVSTPIRTCKGERFLVSTGVPSGSCWTNLIDSIVNALVTRTCFYETTGAFPVDEIYLGDDGVIIARGVIDLELLALAAKSEFGLILNTDKSYVTTNPSNVHFLGYFNYGGFPFKNQDFLIASFIQPEHTRTSVVEACAAALGQMWSGFDPLYAVIWFNIICDLADRDNLTLEEVQLHMRSHPHRHKYLNHVGINPKTITIPTPRDGLILDVLPSRSSTYTIKRRTYDVYKLWQSVGKYFN
ncbi:RdRp [Hubei diptera virus 17]|uniref:RdRp n=1 Tax=Hubei diptera virus 17 TaxID=1922878 RepID=UPI00090CBC37|nr:RdRp [Hubei diptera virus 17]APG78258.1 RdRp [Hubei diptera virus 17]